jgi:ATP-dependent RNA helicase DDX42
VVCNDAAQSRHAVEQDIKNVVNFDVAKNIETHIHRIGRTGRMGVEGVQPGTAYTLITRSESAAAIDLVRNLRMSKQEVPAELERLAQSNPRYHAAMNPRREKHSHGLGFGGQSHPQMTSFMASQEPGAGGGSKRAFDHAGGKEASQAPRRSRFSDTPSPAASAASAPAAPRPTLKGFVPATHTAQSFGEPGSQATQQQQESVGKQQAHSIGSGSAGAEPRRKSRWDS